MEFTADKKTVTVTDYEVKNGLLVFTFDGIGPHRINLTVDAVLKFGDEALDEKRDFSAEKYCLEASEIYKEDKELISLIDSIVLYAKAAAEYMGLDASVLFKGYEPKASDIAPKEEDNALLIDGNDTPDLYVYSLGVHFDTVNRIYAKIYSQDVSFTVSFNGTMVDLDDVVSLGDGLYIVYSAPILPTQFDINGLQKISVCGEDGALLTTVEYTVNTYAYYMATSDSTSPEMKALANALYRYGASAKAYAQKSAI